MEIKTERKITIRFVLFAALSVLAGMINGLLGAGGGILFIFMLSHLKHDKSSDASKNNFATTIAAILPISAVSAYFYLSRGTLPISELPVYLLPAIAGGVVGACLLDKVKTSFLKKLFALVVIYSGVSMLLRK